MIHSPCPTLAQLAERLESTASWDDLTLPESDCQRLREIAGRMKHKATMAESSGHSAKISPGAGVTALFTGSSGTGKTMAAAALANDLNLALYWVDLRRIVSKSIGETEKNLQRVFEEGELSNAVLFFDEADALFGKRSEVQDSHDRYANLEIASLLQRMETYPGLAILATDLGSALDEASVCRLDCVIEFPRLTDSQSVE